MTEAEFIDLSVRHQFDGSVRRATDDATCDAALRGSSGTAVVWRGQPLDDGLGVKRRGALQPLIEAGADFDLCVDMQDRRVRPLAAEGAPCFPMFTFNRRVGDRQRILLPLGGYHDIGSRGFLGNIDPTAVPWAEKVDRFAWRGSPGGRSADPANPLHEGGRLKPLLRALAEGKLIRRTVKRRLQTFPRHRFIMRYIADPRADVGFIDGQGLVLAKEPMLADQERPRITLEGFQRFKYLVVLRGLDIGSSFFWTMSSGSVGLVMETPYESFGSVHFRPWEHYVPFREDLADFEDRLAWCQANQDECQAIAARAADQCRLLARGDLRQAITRRIVDELRLGLTG